MSTPDMYKYVTTFEQYIPVCFSVLCSIDKTYKMFYGGGQKRPENGMSLPVSTSGANGSRTVVYIPDGGQKDLKNAIDAAASGAGT